jgi:hypothetical protein
MTRFKRKAQRVTVRGWREATGLLNRWRKDLKTLTIELKQPRVIDVAPIDFVSGEPVEREGKQTKKFRGQLIYSTNDDVTVRRPSGTILVIDRYEVVAISDGQARFEPH